MKKASIKGATGSKKGVINIVELMIVVITLFVSFTIFFPQADYKNRWEDAYIILKSRDMILLLERTGNLHTYAFEPELVESFFETLFPPGSPESNLIVWSETEGGIKSDIKIACECSSETIESLAGWVNGLKLNERDITINFCSLNLDSPEPCLGDSDAMLISGYKPLQPYEQLLSGYIAQGKGIIEVMDFDKQSEVDDDPVQTDIFGLRWIEEKRITMDYVEFAGKPHNTADITFNPYKYFYHIPLPLSTVQEGTSIEGCSYDPAKNGTLNITGGDYWFWICNETHVWFDTDGDENYDVCVKGRDRVTISGYTFMLNYINSDSSISVSFKPDYIFDDFLSFIFPGGLDKIPPGDPGGIWRTAHLEPRDGDQERVLLTSISESPSREYPAVILNQFGETGVAWIASFNEDGFSDDEKLLLTSLLFWASDKRTTSAEVSNLRIGYMTSYVNAKNIDMFEAYKFNLGLGYPF